MAAPTESTPPRGETVLADVGRRRRREGQAAHGRRDQPDVVSTDRDGHQIGLGGQRIELHGHLTAGCSLRSGDDVLGDRTRAGDVDERADCQILGQNVRIVGIGLLAPRCADLIGDPRARCGRVTQRDVIQRNGRVLRRPSRRLRHRRVRRTARQYADGHSKTDENSLAPHSFDATDAGNLDRVVQDRRPSHRTEEFS